MRQMNYSCHKMLTDFTTKPVERCFSIARPEVYTDIISKRIKGDIDQVWLSAGHIFVSLAGGKHLVTFDAKHADYIQSTEQDGNLDLQVDSPILNILPYPPSDFLIVQASGQIQAWSYRSEAQCWHHMTSLSLCSPEATSLVSLNIDVTQNLLYWCEQHTDTEGRVQYSVYKRKILHDDVAKNMRFGPPTCLVHHCPMTDIYPVSQGIILVARHPSPELTFTFLIHTLTGQIDLVMMANTVTVPGLKLHSPVDFRKLVIKCLGHIKQIQTESPVLQTLYIPCSQTVLQLHQDATLRTLATVPMETTEFTVPTRTVRLEEFQSDDMVGLTHMAGALIVLYKHQVRIYSLMSGCCLRNLDTQGTGCGTIMGASHTLLAGNQPAFYTEEDLYLIQRCQVSEQQHDQILLEMSHFQSDAVRLSYIDKMQRYVISDSETGSIEGLRERWLKDIGVSPTTRLNETVEPFLQQYWSLEQQFRDSINNPKSIPDIQDVMVSEEVTRLLDPMTSTPRSARPSQLHLLTHWYPAEVITAVLKYFDIGTGELTTSQHQRWQSLLTSDTGDNQDPSLLEVICHILYKYKPGALLPFLHRGQQVWEKKVGVSAFIRRKQSLLIYERAVKCLPLPHLSSNPDTAISVLAHIILVSEVAGSVLKALRLLLQYKKWQESIDVLIKHKDARMYPLLYQMVLGALTQNHMLSKYGDQIFRVMPSMESFLDIAKDSCLDTSEDVLCSDRGVSVGAVKPYFLAALNKGSNK